MFISSSHKHQNANSNQYYSPDKDQHEFHAGGNQKSLNNNFMEDDYISNTDMFDPYLLYQTEVERRKSSYGNDQTNKQHKVDGVIYEQPNYQSVGSTVHSYPQKIELVNDQDRYIYPPPEHAPLNQLATISSYEDSENFEGNALNQSADELKSSDISIYDNVKKGDESFDFASEKDFESNGIRPMMGNYHTIDKSRMVHQGIANLNTPESPNYTDTKKLIEYDSESAMSNFPDRKNYLTTIPESVNNVEEQEDSIIAEKQTLSDQIQNLIDTSDPNMQIEVDKNYEETTVFWSEDPEKNIKIQKNHNEVTNSWIQENSLSDTHQPHQSGIIDSSKTNIPKQYKPLVNIPEKLNSPSKQKSPQHIEYPIVTENPSPIRSAEKPKVPGNQSPQTIVSPVKEPIKESVVVEPKKEQPVVIDHKVKDLPQSEVKQPVQLINYENNFFMKKAEPVKVESELKNDINGSQSPIEQSVFESNYTHSIPVLSNSKEGGENSVSNPNTGSQMKKKDLKLSDQINALIFEEENSSPNTGKSEINQNSQIPNNNELLRQISLTWQEKSNKRKQIPEIAGRSMDFTPLEEKDPQAKPDRDNTENLSRSTFTSAKTDTIGHCRM